MTGIPVYYLVRDESTESGTPGNLYDCDSSTELCRTMELPWDDNIPQQSCIPTGEYEVFAHTSEEHPGTWELDNVPGRSGILIHNGNTDNDSLGCILVGDKAGEIDGKPAVLNSNATLEKLRTILPDHFILDIS